MSAPLELILVTYHEGLLKIAETKEGIGSLYQQLAAVLWLSPDDLRLLGVNIGKPVELRSAAGSIVVQAKSDPNSKPGMGYMPFSLYSLSLSSYDPAKGSLPNFKRIEVTALPTNHDITPISEIRWGEIA
jgi:formylmethanofuran dehydrogenase subunit D